jgi:hypothetical protein
MYQPLVGFRAEEWYRLERSHPSSEDPLKPVDSSPVGLNLNGVMQVQRWAPTADRRLGVQILIGFGSASVNIQYEGVQTDAQAAIQASGLLDISGIQVRKLDCIIFWVGECKGLGHITF